MSENKRSLAVNSFYSVVYKLLNVLFPLLTSAYTARILLADGVGKIAFAQNIVQYFVIIAALGIPNYGIREVAKRQDSPSETNKLFTELLIINTVSTTVCLIVYYSAVTTIPYFAENRPLHLVVGLTLLLNYLNVDWFYQGKEEYGYIAARNFLIKLLSLIAIFIFVREKRDFIVYALITSLAIAGNNVLNILHLRGKVRLSFAGLEIREHLKPVFFLLASSISIELYTLLDTTMLGAFCNDEIVGYYTNSTKLARIINSTISSIALVLLPRLSYYRKTGNHEELNKIANRVLMILITLTVPAAVGVFILSNDIIPVLFGLSFEPAIITLRFLSVLVIAVALNNFFGTQILMTFGLEKKLLISVLCGAAVNIVLNSILIPRYAHNGAALASAVSEVVVMIVTYIFAKHHVDFSIKTRFIVSLLLSTISMAVAVELIKLLKLSSIVELCVGVAVGVIVYGIMGLLLRNEGIIDILNVGKSLTDKVCKTITRKR